MYDTVRNLFLIQHIARDKENVEELLKIARNKKYEVYQDDNNISPHIRLSVSEQLYSHFTNQFGSPWTNTYFELMNERSPLAIRTNLSISDRSEVK